MDYQRFKIEYGKCRTDKWGHMFPSTYHCEYTNNLQEALDRAKELSKTKKWKNCSINVLDLRGPVDTKYYMEYGQIPDQIPEYETWLIYSYENGVLWTNDNYPGLKAS
jgi:hypothetical protein